MPVFLKPYCKIAWNCLVDCIKMGNLYNRTEDGNGCYAFCLLLPVDIMPVLEDRVLTELARKSSTGLNYVVLLCLIWRV